MQCELTKYNIVENIGIISKPKLINKLLIKSQMEHYDIMVSK